MHGHHAGRRKLRSRPIALIISNSEFGSLIAAKPERLGITAAFAVRIAQFVVPVQNLVEGLLHT